MKKFLSILLVFSIVITLCMNVSAVPVSVYDASSAYKNTTLTITNRKAVCYSEYRDSDSNIKAIKITQTLEKHAFLWFWSVYGGEWPHNVVGKKATSTNIKLNVENGTYHVKSVFLITLNDGSQYTVTDYSSEVTVS